MNALTNTAVAANLSSEAGTVVKRDYYGAISKNQMPLEVRSLLREVLAQIEFEIGIESINKRGGFIARNVEVYGYDIDRGLIAIQLRQAWKMKESHWLSTKKVYALAGLDEGEQLFCHAVPSSFQRMKGLPDAPPADVVRWAESKIFRVPVARLNTIIRQGDVALVPVRSIPASARRVDLNQFVLRESHNVIVDGIYYRDADAGRRFVDGMVEIDHAPGEHRSIDAEGRFEIVLGTRREDFDFVDANTVD